MPRTEGNGTGPHRIPVEDETHEEPPEPAAARVAKWLTSWQAIAAVVATLFLAGGAAALAYAGLAKKLDVEAAVAAHERQGIASRAQLLSDVADHSRRIRTLEDQAIVDREDRAWIIKVLDEQRRRQRLDAPEPPRRKTKVRALEGE